MIYLQNFVLQMQQNILLHLHIPSIFYPLISMNDPFLKNKLLPIVIKLQMEEHINIVNVIRLATSIFSVQRIINNQFNKIFISMSDLR